MYISNTLKKNIEEEFNNFKNYMYGDNTISERKNLDQFFTPANFTLETLRNYKDDSVTSLEGIDILDPCCGSGCLLASCIIAGADPKRVYGNDYDGDMVELCKKHLVDVCLKYRPNEFTKEELEEIFRYNIHRGNALQKRCLTDFSSTYERHYRFAYIDDLEYAQGKYPWTVGNNDTADGTENGEAEFRKNSKIISKEISNTKIAEVDTAGAEEAIAKEQERNKQITNNKTNNKTEKGKAEAEAKFSLEDMLR